mmetsp:Transcript_17491/g.45722  ORF Transcript_17491/g.45722 Transcript_17491/m.45722 type:complete len:632 (-) Transcript_17491:198-2093(-)
MWKRRGSASSPNAGSPPPAAVRKSTADPSLARRALPPANVGQAAPAPYASPNDRAPEYASPYDPGARGRRSSSSGADGGAAGGAKVNARLTEEAKIKMASPGDNFHPWELKRGEIKKIECLKESSVGQVHKGMYRDPSRAVVPIMLKELHRSVTEDERNLQPRRTFLFEAQILMELTHPNIDSLFGVCTTSAPWYLVTEHFEYGDLRTVLMNLARAKADVTQAELIQTAQNIGAGMLYLASKQFIHRDLRACNCSVAGGENGETLVKIADFGMSSVFVDLDHYSSGANAAEQAIRWMSPESMRNHKFTLRSDCWSFGMLLYEIFSLGGVPYEKISAAALRGHVLSKKTPGVPKTCSSRIVGLLMNSLWTFDAKKRPDAFEITSRLAEAMSRSHTPGRSPAIRNIGVLATGGTVSPYAELSSAHATYASRADLAAGPYAGLTTDHAVYATTPAGVAERELYGRVVSVSEDGTTYKRRPIAGPGAAGGGASTYEALENDRAIYASTNGLGSSYDVPGLDPHASYYHGVCSRPIAERALLSQGPAEKLDGTFLVRQSPRAAGTGSLVVSMVFEGVIWHYKMEWKGTQYHYYDRTFSNQMKGRKVVQYAIDALIEHHSREAGAMLCCMAHPCTRF